MHEKNNLQHFLNLYHFDIVVFLDPNDEHEYILEPSTMPIGWFNIIPLDYKLILNNGFLTFYCLHWKIGG